MKQQYINEAIATLREPSRPIKAFVALDGYMDKIQKVVASTSASNERAYYCSLDAFGKQIQQAAGKSTQIEVVSEVVKLGGNAPIMAQALASLGISNHCVGTFGATSISPIFQSMHNDVELHSVGDSATTNALEFEDGKLMLSEVSVFEQIDWAYVKAKVGLAKLIELCREAELIALVDWTNLPHATDIWRGLLQEVVIPHGIQAKVFFDLCDPKKKTDQQIVEVLDLISRFDTETSADVLLGLNENEATQIYECLKRVKSDPQTHKYLAEKCQYIFDVMDIHSLIVHPIDGCYLVQQEQSIYLKGKVVAQPKISTGGGDNFNAGFCYGILHGMSSAAAMLTAMATSGAYVQNGESPSKEVLIDYINKFSSPH